jgi:hypothetical protein
MAARSGMTNLISRFRSLVDDAGTAAFTDDRAQAILDGERFDFYQEPLAVTAQQVAAGSVAYHVYTSQYQNLEGTASGTVAFRLYDSLGTVITSGYTFDDQLGRFTFTASQAGSARYLDGRSYDLYGAAAAGWRERAGQQADGYDFRVEGRQFSRSQWFEHCMKMATFYDGQRTSQGRWGSTVGVIERSDMIC